MAIFGKSEREDKPGVGSAPGARLGKALGDSVRLRGGEKPRPVARPASRNGEAMANLGKSISFKGDLTGDEDLLVEGKVEGRVDLTNNELTIGAGGDVQAEVHAKSVVVIGHINGNLSATERIEVQASGVVDGEIKTPRLVVQEGAMLNGPITMGKAAAAAPSGPPRPGGPPGPGGPGKGGKPGN